MVALDVERLVVPYIANVTVGIFAVTLWWSSTRGPLAAEAAILGG
jgi:hypothetical protein